MDKIKVDRTKFKALREDFPEYATINEIQEEIRRLNHEAQYYSNKQLAQKTVINSSYGALASKYFVGFNIDVASSVTEMGRNIVKFGAEILDDYFLTKWHLDTEVHDYLGLSGKPIQIANTVLRYGDSVDSLSKINIKYKEYEVILNDEIVTFSEYSNVYINRNHELFVVQVNEIKDTDEIIHIVDLLG